MKRIIVVVVSIMLVAAATAAHASLRSDRSTRAFSMEGAFAAQADDSSAVWYNPAGLVQKTMPRFDFTFQRLSPDDINAASSYDMTQASIGWNLKYVGLGINRVTYDYSDKSQVSDWDIAFATNFGTGRFSLGLAGGQYLYDAPPGSTYKNSTADEVHLGLLIKIVDMEKFALNFGAVNRPQVIDNDNSAFIAPDSKELGLNAQIVTGFPIININVQQDSVSYKYSDIKSTMSYLDQGAVNTCFGLEISFPFAEAFSMSVRAGKRSWAYDKSRINTGTTAAPVYNYYFDSDSTSVGLGFTFGGHVSVDFGSRTTSYSNPYQKGYDRSWSSLSASLLF